MFNLTPISTANLLSIVQIVVVISGFYFSWKGLKATYQNLNATNQSLGLAVQNFALGTSNAQAQLFNQMVIQGRDLQFKFAELFHGGDGAENLAARQDQYIGTLLGYYSSCFELKKVLELPENVERLLAADLRELMRERQVRDKWEDIKHLHSRDFVSYVDGVRAIQ
jgi:hypothetical protein